MKNSHIKYIETYSGFNYRKFKQHFTNSNLASEASVPIFSEICKEITPQAIKGFMTSWINFCEEFLKIKGVNKMKENDIFIVQITLCTEFGNLKISEFAYVFFGIVLGNYGPFYNRWNAAYLIQAFTIYAAKRAPAKKINHLPKEISIPTQDRTRFVVLGLIKNRGFSTKLPDKFSSQRSGNIQSEKFKLSKINQTNN